MRTMAAVETGGNGGEPSVSLKLLWANWHRGLGGSAILSVAVKSLSDFNSGLFDISQSEVELIPETPTTSTPGMPLALAQRVTKPGAPVPAKSSVPAIIASLMTLPPSEHQQVILMAVEPGGLGAFLQELLVLHHEERQVEDAKAFGDGGLRRPRRGPGRWRRAAPSAVATSAALNQFLNVMWSALLS